MGRYRGGGGGDGGRGRESGRGMSVCEREIEWMDVCVSEKGRGAL